MFKAKTSIFTNGKSFSAGDVVPDEIVKSYSLDKKFLVESVSSGTPKIEQKPEVKAEKPFVAAPEKFTKGKKKKEILTETSSDVNVIEE